MEGQMEKVKIMTDKCAHTPCKCAAPMVGGFCSEYCEQAVGGSDTNCKCEHPECT